jgi:hypothetical protein
VVEVKSSLHKDGVTEALENAASVHALRPYGKKFLPQRPGGTSADDGLPRCFYTLMALDTDLSHTDWLAREWRRLVLTDSDNRRQYVDMLVVLERGIIKSGQEKGMSLIDQGTSLQQWFVAVSNFLAREARRRPPVDWQAYSGSAGQGWITLDSVPMSPFGRRPAVPTRAKWMKRQ